MNPKKMAGIGGLKEVLRRQMRLRLDGLPELDRVRASLEICRIAARLPAFHEGAAVAVFASLPTEPEIAPLVEEAWAHRKQVAFPFMTRETGVPALEWRVTTSWDELTVAGPFGLREPNRDRCPLLAPLELDCIFVPGLAFDRVGHRLGRGGGYYDAALALLDVGTPRLGLMFACQQVDEVPIDAHDQALEAIVTEDGVIEAG